VCCFGYGDPGFGQCAMSDGHFELRNVPSGRYRLKVSRDGYVEQEFGQKKPHRPWSDVRVEAESEDVRSDF